jgi:hypothetical protein
MGGQGSGNENGGPGQPDPNAPWSPRTSPREHPKGPQSPLEHKFDDVEKDSRAQRKNQASNRSWRGSWNDKDW